MLRYFSCLNSEELCMVSKYKLLKSVTHSNNSCSFGGREEKCFTPFVSVVLLHSYFKSLKPRSRPSGESRSLFWVCGSDDSEQTLEGFLSFRFPPACGGDVGERRSGTVVSLQRCQAACCTIHASCLTAVSLSTHRPAVSMFTTCSHKTITVSCLSAENLR